VAICDLFHTLPVRLQEFKRNLKKVMDAETHLAWSVHLHFSPSS
jgi:hypothetical protein